MDISILTCPQCSAMVLSDAARCHVCDHVLDQARVADEPVPQLPTDDAVAEDLERCESCGETFRRGLVRCWSCGAFTRQEIKDAYSRMASDPQRLTMKSSFSASEESLAPEVTTRSGPWKVLAVNRPTESLWGNKVEETAASDDDFSFELADSIHLTDAPVADEEPIYGLKAESIPLLADPAPVLADPMPAIPVLPASDSDEAPIAISKLPVSAEPDSSPAPVEASDKKSGKKAPAVEGASELSHKEATAGDVLLEIARQEEADQGKVRSALNEKLRKGFVVYCPRGCRIRVQERHRGKAGKCPSCQAVFFVPRTARKPKLEAAPSAESAAPVAGAATTAPAAGKWPKYVADLHLHAVVPQKLRIRPDSLLNDFSMVDAAFSAEGLLLITLVTAPGFLGANLKKKPALREAAQNHLSGAGTVEGLPAPQSRLVTVEQLKQLAMAQPSPADVESLFGNIPVFGAGRIAVRLPKVTDQPSTDYLSFSLSEFRTFAKALEEICGVPGLGADTEVPLTESYNTVKCHYNDTPVRELLSVEYYQKDPQIKLTITGWRCGGCALTISEDGRKKEKIGGLNGKGIASAKCPKCQAKFGNFPVYEVAAAESAASASNA